MISIVVLICHLPFYSLDLVEGKTVSINSVKQPKIVNFLSKFIEKKFHPSIKILLLFDKSSTNSTFWLDTIESIASLREVTSISGGVATNSFRLTVDEFNSSSLTIPRPTKVISNEGDDPILFHLVLLILPSGLPTPESERKLHERLNLPLLDPPTIRNFDKYVIITEDKALDSLYSTVLIRRLKFKLFLTESEIDGSPSLRQFCFHCPNPEVVLEPRNIKNELNYFPDFQLNYFGYPLRASSTDKMGGDLEFAEQVTPDGRKRTIAKRGVFASAMYHLASGLNFTPEPYPSSPGGATGHALPNGTWVGAVGDVYNGVASFCMLCGMSYNRHFIVEICSPVTYEYIRFAIGPPEKLYSWQAIFWPFDGLLWLAIAGVTALTTVISTILLRVTKSNSSWNAFKVFQYLIRIFIEQAEELPDHLPLSMELLVTVWLMFSLIGATLYRAKMVTFMTFPLFEKTPETYEELVEPNSKYEIEFHYFPNIAYNSFKSSTNPVIVATFQKMLKQPDPIKCLQHTLSSKSVCIMFTSVHEDLISRNMSDRFGVSPIRSSSNWAFMFTPGISSQKRAEFTENFRKILQTSLAMGLNEWWQRSDAYLVLKMKNNWVKSIPPGGDRSGVFQYGDGGSDDVLRFKHLKGAFGVLLGGLLTALGFFFGEQGTALASGKKRKKIKKKWGKPMALIRVTKV